MNSSYRPHNSGHDYSDKGIYLITLVVRNRAPLLGRLNMDSKHPKVELTVLGDQVRQEWEKTSEIQARRGNKMHLLAQTIMPDHWHGVVCVEDHLDKSLGAIVQAVKSACTVAYRKINGSQPSLAVNLEDMSYKKRQAYYETLPATEQPLFDDNYDDTICMDEEHLSNMVRYVEDNPRRAIVRQLRPDFMKRCLHVNIDGRDYAAFGNLFLLRWPRKVQVFCHRFARCGEQITNIPYLETEDYRKDHEKWVTQIMDGGTVLVTPGISPGEERIKNECLEKCYPLIHIQKEPIGPFWKPEKSRFTATEHGTLLILAPLQPEQLGESDYAIFHNLNKLAADICSFNGEAKIM